MTVSVYVDPKSSARQSNVLPLIVAIAGGPFSGPAFSGPTSFQTYRGPQASHPAQYPSQSPLEGAYPSRKGGSFVLSVDMDGNPCCLDSASGQPFVDPTSQTYFSPDALLEMGLKEKRIPRLGSRSAARLLKGFESQIGSILPTLEDISGSQQIAFRMASLVQAADSHISSMSDFAHQLKVPPDYVQKFTEVLMRKIKSRCSAASIDMIKTGINMSCELKFVDNNLKSHLSAVLTRLGPGTAGAHDLVSKEAILAQKPVADTKTATVTSATTLEFPKDVRNFLEDFPGFQRKQLKKARRRYIISSKVKRRFLARQLFGSKSALNKVVAQRKMINSVKDHWSGLAAGSSNVAAAYLGSITRASGADLNEYVKENMPKGLVEVLSDSLFKTIITSVSYSLNTDETRSMISTFLSSEARAIESLMKDADKQPSKEYKYWDLVAHFEKQGVQDPERRAIAALLDL
eukprot:Gregarina_sp_Poly_1__9864@NODE_639_length_7008_cov_29_446477_g488_i0_p2_GENE_NODE_639_length_7008_cov_29_446477_g488_i0NODE_639_length_7008_cov_29_446477_g488_i0_p2_ORF_typecomplete_len461_score63_36_NODE_639_length_7008_cov_29_446477_g488_i02981680